MNEKSTERKKETRLWKKLLNNNRFLMVISLLASVVVWVVMMNGNSDETLSWKIDNVPITVEYTTGAVELGYKMFDTDRTAVTVSVSGNPLSVRQVQASDVEVVATINDSVKPGSNTITLTARKKGDSMNSFVIENIEPGTINAQIDVDKDAVFQLENGIIAAAAENYYMGTPQLSVETVSVSGPEKVVSQIKVARVEYELTEALSETKSFTAAVVLYNEDGEVIESKYLTLSSKEVEVKLPVYWQKSVNLEATFTNRPTSFPSKRISMSPSSVIFAGKKEALEPFKSITLNPIDFSKVNLSTTKFSADIVTPEGFVNTSNAQATTITFDLTDYVERLIVIEEITPVNVPSNVTITIPDKVMSVVAIGPGTEVSQLTDKNIYARINLSGQQFTESGEVQLPVTVSVQDNTTCWVYGTYTVTAQVNVD